MRSCSASLARQPQHTHGCGANGTKVAFENAVGFSSGWMYVDCECLSDSVMVSFGLGLEVGAANSRWTELDQLLDHTIGSSATRGCTTYALLDATVSAIPRAAPALAAAPAVRAVSGHAALFTSGNFAKVCIIHYMAFVALARSLVASRRGVFAAIVFL